MCRPSLPIVSQRSPGTRGLDVHELVIAGGAPAEQHYTLMRRSPHADAWAASWDAAAPRFDVADIPYIICRQVSRPRCETDVCRRTKMVTG